MKIIKPNQTGKFIFLLMVTLNFLIIFCFAGYTQDIVIKGGWLFDATGDDVVRNTGIVIKAGRFLEVGADLSLYNLTEAKIIELSDEDYILPGIFDLHSHHNVNLMRQIRRDECYVNPIVNLANGVTSTYTCGEYNPEDVLFAKKKIDSGDQIGARIFISGPYFGRARTGWNRNATAQDIYDDVDLWAARGVACFKAKGITAEHLKALIERAHMHGKPVTAHLGSGFRNTVNPKDAILMGLDRVEHFLGGDALTPDKPEYASLAELDAEDPRVKDIIDLYVKYNVYFDPTLSTYGYYGKRNQDYDYWVDERKFFTPFIQARVLKTTRRINERFEKILWVKRKTIKKYYDAGGLITLGTDHPSWGEYISGFSAHRELEAFVLSGIPPAAALKIATINGAKALNVSNMFGTIETGKIADLFVIKGNPLKNIQSTRNVQIVIKAGQIYDPKALLKLAEGKLGPIDEEEARYW